MPFKHVHLHMKNEEGSGLVLALMTLLVLSVLGASLGAVTIGSFKLGDVNRDDTSAYYIAEAGANLAYEEMKSGVLRAYENSSEKGIYFNSNTGVKGVINSISGNTYKFDEQFGEIPTATITVSEPEGENPKKYQIISTGEVEGETRIVEKTVEVNWIKKESPVTTQFPRIPNNTPVIVGSSLKLENHPGIDGHILYDAKSSSVTTANANHNNGNVTKNEEEWSVYERFIDTFPSEPKYATTTKISNNMTLSENTYIKNFITKGNTTIDTKGNDIVIVVDQFKLKKGHSLNAKGDGEIFLYIKNDFSMDQDAKINGQTNQINILYAGERNFYMTNLNNTTNGSIFIKQADIEIGQNSKIKGGFLISGGKEATLHQNFNFDEGIMFFPHGTVLFQGTLNGTVIAENLILKGGNYNKKNITREYPFSSMTNGQSNVEEGTPPSLISSEPAIEPN